MQQETPGGSNSRDAASLRAACEREGCPICMLVIESVQHFMDTWQYEGFTDVEHRHLLIQSRGFCPLHTWQLAQNKAPFQLAVVYQEVLTEILDDLNGDTHDLTAVGPDEAAPETAWKKLWKRKGRRRKPVGPAYDRCPICRIRAAAEQRFTGILLEQLPSQEMHTLLCQSTGLCLQHFAQARQQAESSDPATLRSLMECQRTCMQRVLEELQEAIRKHDYRFTGEPRGSELTSWRRAAQLCAGNPGVR